MASSCGCHPGTYDNGWHETRSEDCYQRELAAFAHAVESIPDIVSTIRRTGETS